jgi:hypothetical protein
LTEEFDGQRKLSRDVEYYRGAVVEPHHAQWKRTLVCRECGREGIADLQVFLLASNGGGRQLRGYWHPACFKKVQHHIIVATRIWVLSSKD